MKDQGEMKAQNSSSESNELERQATGLVHQHDCTECPARFDCDGSEWDTARYGECEIDMCRRCRERLHSSSETADLMPSDYYAIANGTRKNTQ